MSELAWIFGEVVSGRPIAQIVNPAKGTQASEDMSGGTVSLALDVTDPTHRAFRNRIVNGLGWRYYVACLSRLAAGQPWVCQAFGSGLRVTGEGTIWTVTGSSIDAYLDTWAVLGEDDAPRGEDVHATVHRLPMDPGTWRQAVQRLMEIQHRSWSVPPIGSDADVLAGGGTHQMTVAVTDLKTVSDVLHEISSRDDGVEVRAMSLWSDAGGDLMAGHVFHHISVGTDDKRYVAGPSTVPFTLTGSASVVVDRVEFSGSPVTNAWVTGGRGSGDMLLRSWSSDALLASGYPQVDRIDMTHGSISDRAALDQMAHQHITDNADAMFSLTMRVRAEAPQQPWTWRAGDYLQLRVEDEGLLVPPGVTQMRCTGRSWSLDDPEVVTVQARTVLPDDHREGI